MPETVLVTGASSGIGRELAKLFAADGAQVVMTARREDELNELASLLQSEYGTKTVVLPHDLAEPEAPKDLAAELRERGITVDILINNAGFGELGKFVKADLARQLSMIQVNVTNLTYLARLFLPEMLARGQGGVLNVASTAAFQPGPNMAVYYATKAYVLSFTEAVREEIARTPLHICCLAPGATKTEFAEEAGMGKTLLFSAGAMHVEDVARVAYRGYRKNRAIIIPGLKNKLGAFLVRLTPRRLVRKLVKRIQRV